MTFVPCRILLSPSRALPSATRPPPGPRLAPPHLRSRTPSPATMSSATPRSPAPHRLTYFDIKGRAEPLRLAFHVAGVAFEDARVPFADWPALKPRVPLQMVPVLERGREKLSQSLAMTRYVGTVCGLCPEDAWEAARVDMAVCHQYDIMAVLTAERDGERKREWRERALRDGVVSTLLDALDGMAKENGTGYFVGDSVTMADLTWYGWLSYFLPSGNLDGVPTTILDGYTHLAKVAETVAAHPKVLEWDLKTGRRIG